MMSFVMAAKNLEVELEDVAGTSWWAGILATLTGQSGIAQMRFVGRVGGETRYTSATFPVPRSFGKIPPKEKWAPGMTAALAELRHEIEDNGWVQVVAGSQPWELQYQH
jgi:hypothetical protein